MERDQSRPVRSLQEASPPFADGASSEASSGTRNFLFRNLIDLSAARPERIDLLVGAGRIIAVARAGQALDTNLSADAQAIDGEGFFCVQALVNHHTHCPMSFFRSVAHGQDDVIEKVFFPLETNLSPEIIKSLSFPYLLENLRSGVSTVFDHYYFSRKVGEACLDIGMRGFIGETVADIGGPFPSAHAWPKARELIDSWPFPERIQPVVAPHASDTVSEGALKEMFAFARSRDLVCHMHLSQTANEYKRAAGTHRRSPVRYIADLGGLGENSLLAHMLYLDQNDLKAVQDSGATIAFCPASQILYERLAPITEFAEWNLPLGLGTDCAACNDSGDLLTEIKTAALLMVHLGRDHSGRDGVGQQKIDHRPIDQRQSAQRAWEAATGGGRKLPSAHKHLPGGIEAGQVADLSFVRVDPSRLPCEDTLYSKVFSRYEPEHMLIDGRWALWRREPVQVSLSDIQEAYVDALEHLQVKTGIPLVNAIRRVPRDARSPR